MSIEMESFAIDQLKEGQSLAIKTESGSTYYLTASVDPERVTRARDLFRGFRVTRESDHPFEDRLESIDDFPALLGIRSGRADGILKSGDALEIVWDRHDTDWDIQLGPRFHDIYTSKVLDIVVVPVQE